MNYVFRNAPFKFPVSPEDAAQELERIRVYHGGKLIPSDVVKSATPKDAVLHSCFEWRNSIAAHQYRQWQARNLIRSVRIEMLSDGKTQDVPYFIHTCEKTEDGKNNPYYQRATVALENFDEWGAAVIEAKGRIKSAEKAVHDLLVIAEKAKDDNKMSRMTIAVLALQTAREALQS